MKLIRILLLLLIPFGVVAQQFPERPNPPKLVNDFTGTLSPEETQALESKLVAYNDSTSTQIAIVMLKSLDGYPIDEYTFQLGDKWGIGRKEKNNGVLVLVAVDDHKIFIATGYGMEGVMPDGLVKRIIEEDIKPEFRAGQYYQGLDSATDDMIRLAAGEYTAEPVEEPGFPWLFFFLVFTVIFLVFFFRVRYVKNYAHTNSIPFWTAWMLLNQARNVHHGSWGGFSGRGGWGGGSSSGGSSFGGFGGGSFGGGGAGGSW